MFSDKNFFVGQMGGWITSLWQDISAPLATQKDIRQLTCNAREILAVHVYAKQLCHGHFNVVLFSIFPKQPLQPHSSPKAVLPHPNLQQQNFNNPLPFPKINRHFAPCPAGLGFPSRSTVMAHSHSCSFTALGEALPKVG